MAGNQKTQSRAIHSSSKWPLGSGLISRTVMYNKNNPARNDTLWYMIESHHPFDETVQRGGVVHTPKGTIRSANYQQFNNIWNSKTTPSGLPLSPVYTPRREPYIEPELYVPMRKFGGKQKRKY